MLLKNILLIGFISLFAYFFNTLTRCRFYLKTDKSNIFWYNMLNITYLGYIKTVRYVVLFHIPFMPIKKNKKKINLTWRIKNSPEG